MSRQKPNPKRAGAGSAPVSKVPALAPVPVQDMDDVEPQADSAATPAWLFVLMIALAYWGMLHLDRYAGGFSGRVYGPYESQRQLADLEPKSGPELLIAKGESIYNTLCVACHQASGLGAPGQYPPLVGSEWVLGSANRLIRIPLHGLTGPIEVKGQLWPNGQMPPFGGGPLLDVDENVAAVLSYIRANWGNKAPPITPEQVKAVRAETSSRSSPWTAEELLRLPDAP